MPRRAWALVAVLVAWTAFVWVNRIANAWGSDTESTGGKVVSTVLSAVMLALAAGAVVVLVRTWRAPLGHAGARVLQAFAGVTAVVWVVRGVQIAVSDHEVGFKVVHVALGVVSIALAVAVWRAVAPVVGGIRPVEPPRPGDGRPLAGAGEQGRR
jgi:hypothetical protein